MQVEGPIQGRGHKLRFQLTYSDSAYTDADRIKLSYRAMGSWLYLGCTFSFECTDAILLSFPVSKNYFPQWVTSWSFGKANHSFQPQVKSSELAELSKFFNLFLLLNYQETSLTLKFELIKYLPPLRVNAQYSIITFFSWLKPELCSDPMQNGFFILKKYYSATDFASLGLILNLQYLKST